MATTAMDVAESMVDRAVLHMLRAELGDALPVASGSTPV